MKIEHNQLSGIELKKTYLGILEYIDNICRKNNIEYSIGCGTLLGAVRHHGFIPWDDDVDIVILRSEYEKLIKAIKQDNNDTYDVVVPEDKGYFYNFAKVTDKRTLLIEENWPTYEKLGVNIDLFPQDYLPEENPSSLVYKAWEYDKGLKYCLTDIAYAHKKKYMRYIKKLVRFCEVRSIRQKNEWYWKGKVQKLVNETVSSSKVACLTSPPMVIWDRSLFGEYTDIKFENLICRCVKNYEKMLEVQYGDYMQMPPKNERKANHDFRALWKNNVEH